MKKKKKNWFYRCQMYGLIGRSIFYFSILHRSNVDKNIIWNWSVIHSTLGVIPAVWEYVSKHLLTRVLSLSEWLQGSCYGGDTASCPFHTPPPPSPRPIPALPLKLILQYRVTPARSIRLSHRWNLHNTLNSRVDAPRRALELHGATARTLPVTFSAGMI